MKVVNHQHLIEKLAERLKGTMNPPPWAEYVKTGHGKQRPPARQDWWYIRSAAVLLSVQKLGPVGVSKLSVKYGSRKNRGNKTERHSDASRNILRKILQQLESGKLIRQVEKKAHKGRIITTQGVKLIDECSKELVKNPPVKAKKAVAAERQPPRPDQGRKQPQQQPPQRAERQAKPEGRQPTATAADKPQAAGAQQAAADKKESPAAVQGKEE
jgi:small subunit ribosomal protein S19e